MNYEEVKTKKTMTKKIQDFFNSIISIFIKKQKGLPASSDETSAEYEKIKEIYNELKEDTFENLKKTYENYEVGTNADGKTVAVERNVGYVVEDKKFTARVRFVSIWRKSAIGNKDVKDEEEATKECFNSDSEGIYNELKDIALEQLQKAGNLDTLEILNAMKNSKYKWARSTSRRLFRNEFQAEIVTDYFRSLMKKVKKKRKKTLTTSQALYGMDEET